MERNWLTAGGKREKEGYPSSVLPPDHLVHQVLRLVEAQATYFQQGHEELNRLAQYRKELGAQVRTLESRCREVRVHKMTLLGWLGQTQTSERTLLCPVAQPGLELSS